MSIRMLSMSDARQISQTAMHRISLPYLLVAPMMKTCGEVL